MTTTTLPRRDCQGKPKLARARRFRRTGPQVVLKIRRRKFKRTFKAGEIVVTRRLFRSGESEYLLNGKLCRLRDIQDIFMGTGLGPESYAIIEQGRIGQILSSKPTDRRAIIEEAAGITKFKTRKRLAEARLEDAKLNLARINDIFDEVTRQMNSLKRQASKAERYARLRDEMRAKLRVVLASKFAQLDAEAAALEQQLTELATRFKPGAKPCSRWKPSTASARSAAMPSSATAQENRERLNNLALELDRAAARRRTNEERCAELDARCRQRASRDWQHPRPGCRACKRSWTGTASRWNRPTPTLPPRSSNCSSASRTLPMLPRNCWR